MRTIKDSDIFRLNVSQRLNIWLKNESNSSNLEKGIYNATIQEANDKKIVKKWENNKFVTLYINRLRSIYFNLTDELVEKVNNKTIKAHEIAYMTHQELKPEKWAKLIEDKKMKDEHRYTPKIEASTDNFTCYKCKSKKCTFYQLQTRSADEPMTTFVTCLDCSNRWKY